MSSRSTASIIVPFLGPPPRFETLLERVSRLELGDDDEVFIADNRPDATPIPESALPPQTRVVPARGVRSAYFARNVAAAHASGDWLVFLDADTQPARDLVSRYLDAPVEEDVAVLAGGVTDWARDDTTVARFVQTRRQMDQTNTLSSRYQPYAQTANCAVRRRAFGEIGGFTPNIRSGGDADLCWRLLVAGWRLEPRLDAAVRHENRAALRPLLAQVARHGTGAAWLESRHPGSAPRLTPREVAGRMRYFLRTARGSPEPDRALFALLDLATLFASDLGRLRSNEVPVGGPPVAHA